MRKYAIVGVSGINTKLAERLIEEPERGVIIVGEPIIPELPKPLDLTNDLELMPKMINPSEYKSGKELRRERRKNNRKK